MKNFFNTFFSGIIQITQNIDESKIDKVIETIKKIRLKKGRIFFLGVGGSAANCSHAVNDFRKLCNIECYTPSDNVSELTARINDEGWDTSYSNWLKNCNLKSNDGIFVFSVGGGNLKKKVSVNIINALRYAKNKKCKIMGVVGKSKSFTEKIANHVVIIPEVDKKLVTPFAEAYQAVIWHYIVSHPKLKINNTKW